MSCQFLLQSKVNQLSIYIYPLLLGPPAHPSSQPSGSSQSPRLSSLAVEQLPASCLSAQDSVCMTVLLSQFIPSSPSPQGPQGCSLYLCLYSCSADKFISIIFLDAIRMCSQLTLRKCLPKTQTACTALLASSVSWYVLYLYPGGSSGKESTSEPGSIPGSERAPGEGNGYPLQYPCLENSMDRGAWQVTVHGIAESDLTE